MSQYIINNLAELRALAQEIARQNPQIICLEGSLGAGKTAFAREYIGSLCGHVVAVTSPTYNIVQIYEQAGQKIYHFDLYRFEHADELLEIGFEEALNEGVCLIEWPEIAKNLLGNDYLSIKIEILENESRKITIAE